ncbi:hypothetical protein D3C78_1597820 [compost metagenome]
MAELDPVVVEYAATFNSDWQEVRDAARMVVEMESGPDETSRQDAAAEDVTIWPTEERIDVIGSNGNDGEHYLIGCATCHGRGRVQHSLGMKPCPACRGLSSCVCRP